MTHEPTPYEDQKQLTNALYRAHSIPVKETAMNATLEKAINDFASIYANTGADWDECIDFAWTVYRRARANGCGFYAALDCLYFEAVRYADM